MPSNPTLPEDVRAECLSAQAEARFSSNAFAVIDAIAPLIIEWAQEEDALVVSRIKHSYNRTGNTFRVLQRVEDAIRAQFTPETTGAPDDHQ